MLRSSRSLSASLVGVTCALALATGCRTATPTGTAAGTPAVIERPALAARYDPSRSLGPLFHDVQLAPLFPDSKTFVDARPLFAPSEIATRYAAAKASPPFDLRAFVEQHFSLPRPAGEGFQTDTSRTMEQHIRELWPHLTRTPDTADTRSSLLPLPNAYVVPGGRFREVYYWDSYFTMLGLVESGRTDLVRSMLDNFAHLVATVGHIPNGNRTYYLSRSQPPYFAAMVGLYARATDTTQALRYLDALEAEHAFWMDGADRVASGAAYRRVVKLPNGALLNRYWDDRADPRPEAYRPDYELGQPLPGAQREAFYRNARATAESGWDFSSRWMRDPSDLRTLETTDLAPVDLNSLLYHAERTIAALRTLRGRPGDADVARRFASAAEERRRVLLAAAFDPDSAYFYDVRWRNGERVRDRPTLAAAAPLYFGLATPEQGRAVAARLGRDFLKPGGFVTTLIASGQQWDAPNGWPPLEWLTIEGVRRYGRADLADTARARWLALNRRTYRSTGKMTEKYDVADLSRRAGGGEYPNQDGFGWTNGVALALSAQERGRAPASPVPGRLSSAGRQTLPVLAFPEPGLDDSAAYQGYETRLFRDAAGNTVQIYLDRREGRVVHLWADAENESLGFTARTVRGRPVPLRWGGEGAEVSGPAGMRSLEYALIADAAQVHLGWFLLGSMRVERDFQYAKRHREPFGGRPFALPEIDRLLAALGRLDAAERGRHLTLLGATDVGAVRARLRPTITTSRTESSWVARIVQPSLDGRDTLALELRADPRRVVAARAGDSISLRARSGSQVPFVVRIATTGEPLTPLTREEIFTPEFLEFLGAARTGASGADVAAAGRPDSATIRARWLERQARGVELLASREKLMAGLPTYATYFGRDMLVSALMMRPIWRDEMSELVVASVLRKLSPSGQVSHEEALGGQAVREAAAEYATLVDDHVRAARGGDRAKADSLLARAHDVLRDAGRVRENYHMIDDELQLPVLAARWLGDPDVPATRKRAFLSDTSDGGGPRLSRLLRELALVARMTAPYAGEPSPANLISFPAGDSGQWASTSWRDSRAGYAGGRYAMDVNAIWAPHALESMARILAALRALGISADSLRQVVPDLMADSAFGRYASDSAALRGAIDTWWGASRHFLVRLGPAEVRSHIAARLAAMPAEERRYWTRLLATSGADRDSLSFLALALDAQGKPIGVANTDPATQLFLGARGGDERGTPDAAAAGDRRDVLRDVRLFVRPYPAGLFVERVGPVVANDAYARRAVWRAFDRDRYHSPRVVWGREVNLFLLGTAGRIASTGDLAGRTATARGDSTDAAYARELRAALQQVVAAVEASGFRSELWSYEFRNGRPVPVRYGSGSDVQLWSTTDLAVQFALSRLR